MAIWRVEFSKEAFKAYQKLSKGYQKSIDRILRLLTNREKVDIKPVEGERDIYRLRVGKYRILLKFLNKETTILVVKIGPRGDIYK
jgi:mRNA interferase RelE/StbE